MAETDIIIMDEDDAVFESQSLIKQMYATTITSDDEYQTVAEFLVKAQATKRAIEKFFDPELTKIEDEKREAEKRRKALTIKIQSYTNPLEDAKLAAQKVMGNYQNQKRIAAEAAERQRLEDQRKRDAEAQAEAKKNGIHEAPAVVPQAAPPPVEATVPKVAGLREVVSYSVRVTAFSQVPDKYKVLNERLVNEEAAALKELFSVPGLEIIKETKMVPTGR